MRREIKWACIFLLFSGIDVLVAWLFTGSVKEALYGIRICAFFYVVFFVIRFYAQQRRCCYIREFAKSGGDSGLEILMPPESRLEREYQDALCALKTEMDGLYSEKRRQEKANNEYYTLWIHQIKTPIAAMRLLIQSKERGESRGRMEQELFAIEQYAQMALHYLHLQGEDSDLVLKEHELSAIVKRAVRKHSVVFIEKKLTMNFEEFSCSVITDDKWFEIMMEQIISNSAKYTVRGEVHIYMKEGNQLIVADTGIGIRKEDLPRIFDRGFTGFNGRQDQCSTGIGLYLASQIAKKLGVCLTVKSEVNQGTEFCVSFENDIRSSMYGNELP